MKAINGNTLYVLYTARQTTSFEPSLITIGSDFFKYAFGESVRPIHTYIFTQNNFPYFTRTWGLDRKGNLCPIWQTIEPDDVINFYFDGFNSFCYPGDQTWGECLLLRVEFQAYPLFLSTTFPYLLTY